MPIFDLKNLKMGMGKDSLDPHRDGFAPSFLLKIAEPSFILNKFSLNLLCSLDIFTIQFSTFVVLHDRLNNSGISMTI